MDNRQRQQFKNPRKGGIQNRGTRVHRTRKHQLIEQALDREAEEALRSHAVVRRERE